MAFYSSILAWKIPWMEEPGRLQSMGSQRVRHDWATKHTQFSSVAQWSLTLCNPVDCSTPGLPVHHQLPEFTQAHVIASVMPSSHLILCHHFTSCLWSFLASGSFRMSQFFASGGQSFGVSALASVLPMNIQDWFPLGWTAWISLQSKEFSRVFSNTTVQKHQIFGDQLSSQSNSLIHTWLLKKPWLWLTGPLLAK